MKRCGKCKHEKELSQFNRNRTRKDGLGTYCRQCNKDYHARHYQNNPGYYAEKQARFNHQYFRDVYHRIGEYLQTHPCVDCGETRMEVLQFDPKFRMDTPVHNLIGERLSWKRIEEALPSYDVRCANCSKLNRRRSPREILSGL